MAGVSTKCLLRNMERIKVVFKTIMFDFVYLPSLLKPLCFGN
jgi:hypothetical protein